MKTHRHSFFGQKCGILFNSADQSDLFVYFTFVKKLPDGRWEKPSQKQGKNIKFNIGEILQIMHVLEHPNTKWSTVHRFKEDNTSINWENKGNAVAVAIPGYSKYMKFPENRILLDILKHVYNEKIEFGTSGTKGNGKSYQGESIPTPVYEETDADLESMEAFINGEAASEPSATSLTINPTEWLDNLPIQDEYCQVPGEITANREKAVSFQPVVGKSFWIPKSQMREDSTGIWVKQWFLSKKVEEIFS